MTERDQRTQSGARLRWWTRRAVIALGVIVALLVVAAWVMTRSFVLSPIIASQLSKGLGGEVSIGAVRVRGFQRVVLENLEVRSPDVGGDAGRVLFVPRTEISTDLLALIGGTIDTATIQFQDAVLRISEDEDQAGRFNFSSLGAKTDDSGADTPIPGLIVELVRGRLEMGTHDGDRWRPTGSMPISGSIHAQAGSEWYNYDIEERDETGAVLPNGGFAIRGRVNVSNFALDGQISGLTLDQRMKSLTPLVVRSWWDRLELDGRVRDAGVRFEPGAPAHAWIAVEDIGITIPLPPEVIWARYRAGEVTPIEGLPRLRVDAGRIDLNGETLRLSDLRGVVAGNLAPSDSAAVPYRINGTIGGIPAISWDDREQWALEVAEFAELDLTLSLDDFRLVEAGGGAGTVELPQVVAEVLRLFNARTCVLNTGVHVTRAAAPSDAAGTRVPQPLRTSGHAKMTEASGAYVKFPYPLENVTAEIVFEGDRIEVLSLIGSGPRGGTVSLGGVVEPLTKWPRVRLRVSGKGLPVDDALREAMSEQYQRIIDALLHERSYQRLAQAGVLPGDEQVARAEASTVAFVQEAERQRTLPLADGEAVAALDVQIARRLAALERLRSMRDFHLGGTVDLELSIDREEGRGQATHTTGVITLHDVGLMFDRFPYPFRIHRGELVLERDGARVRDWLGVAAGGGQVLVNGDIRTPGRPEGGVRIAPDLTIGVIDDVLNPALLAAIPFGSNEAREDEAGAISRVGRMIEAAGLEGIFRYVARIGVDEAGEVDWSIDAVVDGARAEPREELTRAMRGLGLFWPTGFSLDQVAGSMTISRRGIAIAHPGMTGRRGEGRVTVQGEVRNTTAQGGEAIDLDVDFTGFALEEYLLNLFPGEGAEAATAFWQRYRPEGMFDASLRYRSEGGVLSPLALSVKPRDVALHLGEQTLRLRGTGERAAVTLGSSRIEFTDLALEVLDRGEPDGLLRLHGAYGLNDRQATLRVDGTVTGARFESVWPVEVLRVLGRQSLIETYESYDPAGVFDASFEAAISPGNPPEARAVIRPVTMEATVSGERLRMTFDPGSAIEADALGLVLRDARGTLASGATFDVTGDAAMRDDRTLLDLNIRYRGRGDGGEILAFLPQGVKDAFQSIALTFGEAVELDGVRLHASRDGTTAAPWSVSMTGPIVVRGATLDAGLLFSNVDGRIDAAVESNPGQPLRLLLDVHADRAVAKERLLANLRARVHLNDAGDALLISDFRADLAGGVVTADVRLQVGEGRLPGFPAEPGWYMLDATAVGVDLRALAERAESASGLTHGANGGGRAAGGPEGMVFAGLSMSGMRGEPASRRGTASLRVFDGTLARNPITMPLLQLSQLMLPLNASLNYAEASAYIEGDVAVVEHILFESDSLLLSGSGIMTLDDLVVDLRLRGRGRGAVPGLSEIVGFITDQIYAIQVTGPITGTRARLVPIPALSGLLGLDRSSGHRAAPALRPVSNAPNGQ